MLGARRRAGAWAALGGDGARAGRRARLAVRAGRGARPNGACARRGAGPGAEDSHLTTVDWLDDVHRLFPKETIERLERDAVERYEITDIVTDPDVLAGSSRTRRCCARCCAPST